MIRDAQKNGLTMFSKTLNAVRFEDQEKKARTEHMKDQFETAVSKGPLDAAALYTITMAEKHPEWTTENIEDYFQIIKLNAEIMIGKEPDELLQMLLDKLFDTIPKTNKSKDKSDNEKIADFLREIGL